MIVAMVSRETADIPDWLRAGIAAAGMELRCRACANEAELLEFAGDARVLWFTGANKCITPRAIERLPECRAIFRSGSGLDSIPLEKARELGIEVHNTPESIAESVAEHAVALLLDLVRRVTLQNGRVRSGKWSGSETLQRWHMSGRVLGLIGYGGIARRVEKMVSGFEMRVVHYDPFSGGSIPLHELLRQADFVSLHCPLTEATRGLIGADEFSAMKDGALLVNTARGEVVDEGALVSALESGRLGGAALDVLVDEPPGADNPLLKMENVVLTPHIAAFSADFEDNFWRASLAKLESLKSVFSPD